MRYILFIMILFGSSYLRGQKYYDQWPFGFAPTSLFDITSGTPESKFLSTPMKFEGTVASICDSMGNLLLYTNGIYIADSSHQMIENGDSLSPGFFYLLLEKTGAKTPWGTMFLKVPDTKDEYYLIHMGLEKNDTVNLQFNPCYYSKIQKIAGKYVAVLKNQIIQEGNLMPNIVVKHGNGRDWWLIQPSKSYNEYDFYVISKEGIHWSHKQSFSINYYYENCHGVAQNSISPDGSKLMMFNNGCGVLLFDFDRCMGMLNNLNEIKLDSIMYPGGGSSFSPNSRFAYVCSSTSIYQIDTYSPKPKLFEVGKYDGYKVNGPAGFWFMSRQTDGKIYLTPTCYCDFMHVINYPDSLSLACKVGLRQLSLCSNNSSTMPNNIPNYLLGPVLGSLCDTLTSVSNQCDKGYGLKLYPNPSQGDISIDITLPRYDLQHSAILMIFDLLGREVYSHEFSQYSYLHTIASGSLVPGLYFASLYYRGQVVKTVEFGVVE